MRARLTLGLFLLLGGCDDGSTNDGGVGRDATTPAGDAGPPAAPSLASFTASPASVPMGRPTRVTWTWTYDAPPVPEPDCTIDPSVGAVTNGDGTSVTLDADTTFTLTCANASGSDTATTSVTVGASTLLTPDRLPPPGTWESAGVEGGIPLRTTICATVTDAPYNADDSGGASAVDAIQRAIDDCGDEEVVFVPAGTYRIDGELRLHSGVTLRGAGADTRFDVRGNRAVRMGGLGPWPPPKANDGYRAPITGGATRGSTTVMLGDTSGIAVDRMVMIDELDDPDLVWTRDDSPGRYRASMHMVESVTANSVTFRPALAVDFTRSPQISWFPDLIERAGVEDIHFVGTGSTPDEFIHVESAWNVWVSGCELENMPAKSILIGWSGHVEIRHNYLHDQANGGPNSEGIDLLADTNWSLIVDNVCVAAGFPQINIGDAGANPFYSGGFGNVIAYNYAVDAYYTDPPDSPDAGKMPSDIGTNHSPHTMYNLVEGNFVGKFGSDGYHGSGSHSLFFRNVATGTTRWTGVSNRLAIQIDRRNTYYSLVGNVFGVASAAADHEYADESGWSGSAIYRLGFPDVGNDGFSGMYPPTDLVHGDGGPRDLYVLRDDTEHGTTLIEGNWCSATGEVDWTVDPEPLPDSYFLTERPAWFGSLAWPPVSPDAPSADPTIIPAGYRYVNGSEP
ncbi:MAG: glycosyl hydrolase family 28-related protein [Sandaracinaceae bacterium]